MIKSMKRILIFAIGLAFALLFSFSETNSQSLNEFRYFNREYADDLYLGIFPTFTFVSNGEAPNSTAHRIAGFTGKLDLRKVNFEMGERRFLYQHKLLFDMLLIIENQVTDDGSAYYRSEESGLTTGFIGWTSWAWNMFGNERYCVAPGVNINDYFLTNSYKLKAGSDNLTTIEPQGYWFAAGPSVFFDYALHNNFLLQTHASYSFGVWRAVNLEYDDTQIDDSYPNPHFGGLNFELHTRWGFFTGLDYNFLINRGDNPNNTNRLDVLIGFRFPV